MDNSNEMLTHSTEIISGFIYMTPALIINGFLMAHNVVDSLTDSRQNVVVGSTT